MPTGIYVHKKLGEEHKRNISISMKGKNTWMKGRKLSEEIKMKISNSLKGVNVWSKGNVAWNKGIPFPEEAKEKMRKNNAHNKPWLGKKRPKLSEETKRKISLALGGTGIPQRPTKRYYHLRDLRYMEWRGKVFQRDNWTCQTCGVRGYVEPHHIKGWAKYPELRYEVNNGVTLCLDCHKLTRRTK